MATIVSSNPSNGETEVYIGSTVSVVFDVDMDPNSFTQATFVIYDQDGNIISGTITYSASTRTATFHPTNPLLVRSTYTVAIIGGAGRGVYTMPDVWGNRSYLNVNYQFTFITNDGRFASPPTPVTPSGVDPNILYPSGVTYYSPFIVGHSVPMNRQSLIDPSGMYLDGSGNPTITICFNKPINLDSILGAGEFCYAEPVTVIGQDVFQDPFVPVRDYTPSGTWSVVQWQAKFTFADNTQLFNNEEITVHLPSNLTAEDGTSLGEDTDIYFTTKLDPMYIGAQWVRLELGNIIADIPDDTINRLIHSNSLLANWYSFDRPAIIKPFTSGKFQLGDITTIRPRFVVDPITGPPEYVKRYVLYKTELDLLKARFEDYLDGSFLGGGGGASKALADLKITEGSGSVYAATIGPLIEKLEGNGNIFTANPYKKTGLVAYWLGYITGNNRWRAAIPATWGKRNPTLPPPRTDFIPGSKTNNNTSTGGGASAGSANPNNS